MYNFEKNNRSKIIRDQNFNFMNQYFYYILISYFAVNTIDDFKIYYAIEKIFESKIKFDNKLVSLICRCELFLKIILHEN